MKLLTINTHSLIESNYEEKVNYFVDAVIRHQPDIIAMQEVNQSQNAKIVDVDENLKMTICQNNIPLRYDNHILKVVKLLKQKGFDYYWTWLPVKIGYDKFDEGLAVMSRQPILKTDVVLISKTEDYMNWKTRKIIGIKTKNGWFYSVHMGWWNDEDEPFKLQFEKINAAVKLKEKVWLMGDFNSRDNTKNEGYDCIISSGWFDTYSTAQNKDNGFTVSKSIDGWKSKDADKIRIDYIFCNQKVCPVSSKVIFNGSNEPEVSDHYGIIVTVND